LSSNADIEAQLKGGEFKDAAFRRMKLVLQGQAKAGWYQGSVFFTIMGESSTAVQAFISGSVCGPENTACSILSTLDTNQYISGLINYRWATDGFRGDGIDKTIVALIATVCFGSAGWYVKTGDPGTAIVLTPLGLAQIVAALRA
jgi:hypothetical protein